jgi:hypothetical protein
LGESAWLTRFASSGELLAVGRKAGNPCEKIGEHMKKNIREIPQSISTKICSFGEQDIVAGCAKQFSAEELRDGALAHLQIILDKDGLHIPERILPLASRGKYSARNREGHEVTRKDLPKEIRTHPVEAPNWGDSYNGTHTVWLPNEAYPVDFYPPRELELVLHCPDTKATRSAFVIAARVEETISQTGAHFDEYLFEDLNLLQENLGACGVEPATSTPEEYSRTLTVSWDILPPGSRDEAIERLFRGRNPTQHDYDVANERFNLFDGLGSKSIVVGSSGFRRYFGALLEDNLVVFENLEYGNAVYLLYQNWQQLSQRSRLDLLSGRLGDQFDRVIHHNEWQTKVRQMVIARRTDMGIPGTENPVRHVHNHRASWRTPRY